MMEMETQLKRKRGSKPRQLIGSYANREELGKEMNRIMMEALKGVDLSFISELSKR